MDSNMTFRLDADVKEQMSSICRELGMTTSTAFNLFARAFVREQMLADAGQILEEFGTDYARMAE